jgi:4-hydroxy-tetrahydrodipicolinate reductase
MRVVIIGAGGRMGLALARAARELTDVRIAGAVTSDGSPHLGRDIGELAGIGALGVTLVSELAAALAECDVALDFSRASAMAANLATCTAAGKPLLIGTSGLAAAVQPELERAARHIALLVAPNTSLGITLLLELVQQCASVLPLEFDVEISEAHHRHKVDAPSGTAIAIGLAIAAARGQKFEEVAALTRRGGASRREGEIGFAVVRAGDLVGEHRVLFAGAGEQLELTHRATDRAVFARNALKAARWLVGRAPGHYSMRDILFRNS